MNRITGRQLALWFLSCAILALLYAFRSRMGLDLPVLGHELRSTSPAQILMALATIYACYWLRAARWAALLGGAVIPPGTTSSLPGAAASAARRVRAAELLPSQLMGFTAVALFGRVADLGRPYLVARALGTPVATQLGVYGVERTLDLGAAAAIFSITLALAPRGLPHQEAFARAGTLSVIATLGLGGLLITIALGGERLAHQLTRWLQPISKRAATSVAERMREFRQGFPTTSSVERLLPAAALSLLMWLGIAATYWFTAHAFRSTPALAELSFAGTVLLMATGIGGSVLQLPGIGWFTQIAVLAAALHSLFGVPVSTATACGALLLLIANLSVVPAGLLAAHLTGTPLRAASRNDSSRASANVG